MPVQSCSRNGKPGYQYGESGKCYTYTRGNEASRKRAKRKAHLQGAAVESSRGGKVKEIEEVQEYDDSLNDYIELIRREFETAYPPKTDEAGTFQYFYVVDVFEDYLVARGPDSKYYEVEFEETEDSITFAEKDSWTPVKLSYVQEMLTGQFRDCLIISEFKGKYPEIPIFEDIDVKELTGGEKNPTFVTLPIGMANVVSGNGRYYDENFVREMERQVREKKPIGLMGHLSKDQRATAFPSEAVHWIGAKRINEILWGKGYIPSGEPRERLQRYKATNKKIATSIDATADGVWDNSLGAYRMIAETLDLAQIDFAPADRAGISNLAAVPLLTTEMLEINTRSEIPVPVRKKETDMEREEAIRSLTVSDVDSLPVEVRSAIANDVIREMRQKLGLPEDADVEATIQEIQKQKQRQQEMAIRGRVTELATAEEGGIRIDSIRELVVDSVMSRKPATAEEAETIYKEISQSPKIQETLSKIVQETMGPPQQTPTPPQSPTRSQKYFVLPETKA